MSCRIARVFVYGRLSLHQLPVPRGDELFRGRFPGRLKVRAQAPHSPHKAPVCATRRPHRARLWRSLDSGKRFGGKRFCCELPAGPGPGAARRAREAKRSVQRCGRNAPSPRALGRAALRERSGRQATCLAYVSADVPQPIAQYRRGRRRAPAFPRWARAVAAQASGVAVLVARLVVNSHQRKGLGAPIFDELPWRRREAASASDATVLLPSQAVTTLSPGRGGARAGGGG